MDLKLLKIISKFYFLNRKLIISHEKNGMHAWSMGKVIENSTILIYDARFTVNNFICVGK